MQSVYAYDNTKYEFSIDSPTGWTIQEQKEPVIISFTDSSNTGAMVNVVVDSSYGATLEQVVTASKEYLPTLYEDYNLVNEGSRVVGRLNGYQIEYTISQSGVNMRFIQVLFIENDKSYVITCSALASVFTLAYLDFEQSIRSFQITSESQTDSTFDNSFLIIIAGITIAVIIVVALYLYFRKKLKPESFGANKSSIPSNPQITYEEPKVSAIRFCLNCKKELPEGNFDFCPFCGNSLRK